MDKQQAITNMKQGKNIPYKHETIATLITMADKLEKIEAIVNAWNSDASHSFEDICKINGILKE